MFDGTVEISINGHILEVLTNIVSRAGEPCKLDISEFMEAEAFLENCKAQFQLQKDKIK